MDGPILVEGARRVAGLTDLDCVRYRHEGIVFPIRVLRADEAARYRGECDELEMRLGGRPRTIEVRQMHLHFAWAFDLATDPRVLDAIEPLLGPDLLVWATELFAKHPGDAAISIGWHRDRDYMGFAAHTTVTAWIALSESTRANGCLRALPGPDRATVELDEREAIDVVLQPGEMSLHDCEIWHGSQANLSATKRVGFAVRYLTPEARPVAGRPPAVLARGRDRFDYFRLVDRPGPQPSEDAVAAMRRSAARHFDAMLETLSHGT